MRLSALFRPVLVLLLVLATQFQTGLMPAEAGGRAIMVICSGDGPMMMVLDPTTGTFHPAPSETRKSGCDWAGCGAVALEPRLAVPVFAPRLSGMAPATAAILWRPSHDPRGVWARGPPLSV